MRTSLIALTAVAVGGAALAGLVFSGALNRSVVSRNVETPLTAEQIKALAPHGAKVAAAADCYACHTARGGAPWAGGMPFETPFGVIHATNISPSRKASAAGAGRSSTGPCATASRRAGAISTRPCPTRPIGA